MNFSLRMKRAVIGVASSVLAISPLLAQATVEPGSVTAGRIGLDARRVAAATAPDSNGASTISGVPFLFRPGAGTWTLELRSKRFDAYLLVHDESGTLVARDDDGSGATDARIVLEADEGAQYIVWACALREETGPFELRAVEGIGPIVRVEEPSPRSQLDRVHAEHGRATSAACAAICETARGLMARLRHNDAFELLEYSLSEIKDSAEHEPARSQFNALRTIALDRLGKHRDAVDAGLLVAKKYRTTLDAQDQSRFANALANSMWHLGQYADALRFAEEAFELTQELRPADSFELRRARELWTSLRRHNGDWSGAFNELSEAVILDESRPLTGRIAVTSNHFQSTEIVAHGYSAGPPRFVSLPIRVKASGVYTIDLRSCSFDGYLVLRDRSGAVIGEDDDARGNYNPRLVVQLEAGVDYALEPTALHGRAGPYRIDLIVGRPEPVSEWELRERNLADVRECQRQLGDSATEVGYEALRILDHIDKLLNRLGRATERVSVRERHVAILQELAGPDSTSVLHSKVALGAALRGAGQEVEAIELLEDVRERFVARYGSSGVPVFLLDQLGRCHMRRRNFEAARELLEEVRDRHLRERGKKNFYIASVRTLAELARQEGRFEQAVHLGQEAVDLYIELEYAQKPGARYLIGNAHDELGVYQEEAGQYESALYNYAESIRLRSLAYGGQSETVALTRVTYAWVLHRVGRFEEAVKEWHTALDVLEREDSYYLGKSYAIGAQIYAARGEYQRSLKLCLKALDLSIQSLSRGVATLPEPARLRMLAASDREKGLALGVGALVPGSEREIYARLLPLKGMVGRGLVESRASARAALGSATLAAIEELRSVQSEISSAFHSGATDVLTSLRARRVQLEDEIARHQRATGATEELTLPALARALPRGSVMIDLQLAAPFDPPRFENGQLVAPKWWEEDHVTAWIIHDGSDDVTRVDLGPAEPLKRAARARAFSGMPTRGVIVRTTPAARNESAELRRLLWDPLQSHVGDVARVFVSNVGFLGAVPFEVLQRDDGSFLIEDHAFVYVSDPAALLAPGPAARRKNASLLLVGDVDYDASTTAQSTTRSTSQPETAMALRGAGQTSWDSLPATTTEVASISNLFESLQMRDPSSSIELLTGENASEEAVEAALSKHTYLHIATHGFFQPEGTASMWEAARGSASGFEANDEETIAGLLPGLLSGLVLAGANLEPSHDREDGLLTAEELTWLDLDGCELVTLSACSTGLGSARGGEGLIGLRRAFHHAGASTVVASLWSVEDEATSQLMDTFYQHLWRNGLWRIDALRAAQLDLLAANRERFGEPRPWTWGAFVLSGEWR